MSGLSGFYRPRVVFCLALLAGMAGCGAIVPTMALEAEVVLQQQHCDATVETTTISWVDEPAELRQLLQRLSVDSINGAVAWPEGVDLDRHGLILVELGQRRTGGYGVTLGEGAVQVVGDIAEVTVHLWQPAPDALTPQVITSPCLLLSLPRAGYREVRVVDTAGRLLGRIPAAEPR